jgi:TatA/E family protein of Tat protein translocase
MSGRDGASANAMFGPIGMQELIIIFVIALIVFGPRKLPELGKSLGKSLAEFRRASNDLRRTLEDEVRLEETRKEITESLKEPAPRAPSEGEAVPTAATAPPDDAAPSANPDEAKTTS